MENAEIHYEPDDEPTPGSSVDAARARFERQFGAKGGVAGIGDTFERLPVLTEVVGEIDALKCAPAGLVDDTARHLAPELTLASGMGKLGLGSLGQKKESQVVGDFHVAVFR